MTLPLARDLAVGDRYVLEEQIAVGGMGEVWRSHDRVLGRTVAVKVLKPEYAADPTFRERFRNEARHTAALSHPGIANVFDYGEIGGDASLYRAYLVMEYVAGEPLSELIGRAGALPVDQTLDIVGQAALALQAAHEAGVVHRDVKPANLLIRPDGVVKVTDFGIARAVDAAPVTQTGLVVGTAAYLSPEQAAGRPVTPASDIYALGVVTYECLAGQRPFSADAPVAVAMAHLNDAPPPLPKQIPPLVSDFVTRALDKQPERRQPSAGDFGRTALALATSLRDTGTDADTDTATTATAASSPAQTKLLPAPAAAPVADDTHRRRVRNTFIAIGAAVVLLGFLLLRACDVSSSPAPTPKPSASPSPTPTPRVVVRTVDYVGRQAAAVAGALRARGLHVREQSIQSGRAAGSVIGVSPTGSLPRGTTVTLQVATPPPAPPPKHPKPHKGKNGGPGDH